MVTQAGGRKRSFAACQWFSLASSTNKTDHNDINEILLKVA
jgi:hypothetical protein